MGCDLDNITGDFAFDVSIHAPAWGATGDEKEPLCEGVVRYFRENYYILIDCENICIIKSLNSLIISRCVESKGKCNIKKNI